MTSSQCTPVGTLTRLIALASLGVAAPTAEAQVPAADPLLHSHHYEIFQAGTALESGNFDGDGHSDLLVQSSGQFLLLVNRGDGSFEVDEDAALPFGATYHVVGLSAWNVPLEGGVLVPALDLINAGPPLDADGGLVLTGPWPSGVPTGLEVWFADPGGPFGWAAFNAIKGTMP